jgi:hypothetical protein
MKSKKQLKCFESQCGVNTDGSPVIIRTCYCGTTGCQKLGNNDYPLPENFNELATKKHYESILRSKLI